MNYTVRCYQKSSSIISKTIGDEVVLVPIRDNTANLEEIFVLSGTGGYIWEHIESKRSVEEIKKLVTKEFNVEPREAEEDLISFFEQLEKGGCIKRVDSSKKKYKKIKGGR